MYTVQLSTDCNLAHSLIIIDLLMVSDDAAENDNVTNLEELYFPYALKTFTKIVKRMQVKQRATVVGSNVCNIYLNCAPVLSISTLPRNLCYVIVFVSIYDLTLLLNHTQPQNSRVVNKRYDPFYEPGNKQLAFETIGQRTYNSLYVVKTFVLLIGSGLNRLILHCIELLVVTYEQRSNIVLQRISDTAPKLNRAADKNSSSPLKVFLISYSRQGFNCLNVFS